MGRTRSLTFASAAIAALAAAFAATAAAKPLAKSTFTATAEGWKVVGDVASDPERPDQIDTGGDGLDSVKLLRP